MNKVVIVVPIYKAEMDLYENISLAQLHHILGEYPICYVMPMRLKAKFFDTCARIEYFDDTYFDSVESYSKLCLNTEFYNRFSDYEYMLIYQTDAFVFSNDLLEFCEMGYDYIGAPLPRFAAHWHEIKARVGNGGFSLRRISACQRLLKRKEYFFSRLGTMRATVQKYEDLFWGYCSTCKDANFFVPSIRLSLKFSIQNDIFHCYRDLEHNMPFGCHAWHKIHYEKWKRIVEKYGYRLPEKTGKDGVLPERVDTISRFLIRRIVRQRKFILSKKEIFKHNSYAVWGAGEDGLECMELLDHIGCSVKCVFDKRKKIVALNNKNIKCVYPFPKDISSCSSPIIVASRIYEKEIVKALVSLGYKEELHFLRYSVICKLIIEAYWKYESRVEKK